MKKCHTCKLTKPFDEFGKNKSNPDGHQGYCKDCGRKKDKRHNGKPERKKALLLRNREVYLRNRDYIIDYLRKNPCVDCGESNPLLLEFDHVKAKGKKTHNIANMKCHSIKAIKKEIAKCEVRCLNCHRKKTAMEQNWEWAKCFLDGFDAPVV